MALSNCCAVVVPPARVWALEVRSGHLGLSGNATELPAAELSCRLRSCLAGGSWEEQVPPQIGMWTGVARRRRGAGCYRYQDGRRAARPGRKSILARKCLQMCDHVSLLRRCAQAST